MAIISDTGTFFYLKNHGGGNLRAPQALVHTILQPALEALHLSRQHDREQRQSVWGQQKGHDQTHDTVNGSTVDDDADRTECGHDGNEIQNNSR